MLVVRLMGIINLLFTVYSFAIILRSLLPWLGVDMFHPVMRFLVTITEPLLAPLRRHIRPVGGLDFTPMVALIILWLVERLLIMVLYWVL